MTEQGQSTPLSWRDVHTLVKESRDEILAAMTKGFDNVNTTISRHDIRLDALEQQNIVAAAAERARLQLTADAALAASTRERRSDRILAGGRGLILLIIAAATGGMSIASSLHLIR